MKQIIILAASAMLFGATICAPVAAQEIKNGPLKIDQECWTDFSPAANGSSVFTTSTRTVTNGATDTAHVKVIGGTASNKLHFSIVANKTSGTTDSMMVKLWGFIGTGCGTTGTYYALDSFMTADASGDQLRKFLSGNDYNVYMITVRRKSILSTAQVSTYKYTFSAR